MTRPIALAVLLTAGLGTASAQTPAKPAPDAAPAPAAPAGPAPPTPPANYIYTVDARRDPFVALLGATNKKGGPPTEISRAPGLAGLDTDEVSVKGILQSQGRWIAMVAGPSGKVYTVRAGDRLADGTIRGITPQFVEILQQVDDPLSLEKQREVRKFLRGGENK